MATKKVEALLARSRYVEPQPGFTHCPYCRALVLPGRAGTALLTPALGEPHLCVQRTQEEK